MDIIKAFAAQAKQQTVRLPSVLFESTMVAEQNIKAMTERLHARELDNEMHPEKIGGLQSKVNKVDE